MFAPDNVPLKPQTQKETQVCAWCGKVPPHGWCLFFPELEGQPLVCSKCVFEKLTGIALPWRKP